VKEQQLLTLQSWSIASEERNLVQPLNLSVSRGAIVGIAGESGSGKTLTLLSLAGLLPKNLKASGQMHFSGSSETSLWTGAESGQRWRNFRRKSIGFIFQEPMSALNPTMRCGAQLLECMDEPNRQRRQERALELLHETGLPDPNHIMKAYPHEISGGQRQRLMIAMALANNPELLLADEPTTALDAALKHQVCALMTNLCRTRGVSLLLVSHDLELLGAYSDQLLVMQHGQVVEQGNAADMLRQPKHDYTKMLLDCRPTLEKRQQTLPVPNEEPQARQELQPNASPVQLHVQVTQKQFRNSARPVLHDIQFDLHRGETICVLGQSGSGKSTLARIICGLDKDFQGNIQLAALDKLPPGVVQLVFQDPFAALNPYQKVLETLEEALKYGGRQTLRSRGIRETAEQLLRDVRLPEHTWNAYPHELSGGQCQRVCVARALCAHPEVIILDESVSALDPSVQASVLNLLARLQSEKQLSYLFITHDLDVAAWISHRLLVLHEGKTDAFGPTVGLFQNPPTDYTKFLFSFR
jgi:peptide/nickel transport system ATP-binding protein